jgi:hypothetical protein
VSVSQTGYQNPPQSVKILQLQVFCSFCERIRKTERRRLGEVANIAEQTCFVGNMAATPLHFDDGDWPSGKAVDSGSTIGGSNPSSPARRKAFESLIPAKYKHYGLVPFCFMIVPCL